MAGEHILVLAVSNIDGLEMENAILEVKPDAEITVVSDPRQIHGYKVDEVVLTDAFAGQRSVRMVNAAMAAIKREG
jgi:hypothetical protein